MVESYIYIYIYLYITNDVQHIWTAALKPPNKIPRPAEVGWLARPSPSMSPQSLTSFQRNIFEWSSRARGTANSRGALVREPHLGGAKDAEYCFIVALCPIHRTIPESTFYCASPHEHLPAGRHPLLTLCGKHNIPHNPSSRSAPLVSPANAKPRPPSYHSVFLLLTKVWDLELYLHSISPQ